MKHAILVHYDEIGLKGKNRNFFEVQLMKNIQEKLVIFGFSKDTVIKKLYGRILVELKNKTKEAEKEKLKKIFKTTFGISHFSFAVETENDINKIKNQVLELLEKEKFQNFRITAQRANKNFKPNSQEVCVIVGEAVVNKFEKSVKLKGSELECFIEITDKKTYIYTKKIKSVGGLPIGVGAKVISLISGGIDSPVATWFAQKRGLETVLVHFHSKPFVDEASVEKVKELVQKLTTYSPKIKLYLCPFGNLQKKLLYAVPDEYRIIIYRRFMYQIAEKIAEKEKALALLSGDSIGQVASQTLENINAVQEAVKLPVLRPLLGFDKKEIIDKAKEIDTFKTSILPHKDCCTMFMPKHPETKAKPWKIQEIEKKLDVDGLVEDVLKELEVEFLNC